MGGNGKTGTHSTTQSRSFPKNMGSIFKISGISVRHVSETYLALPGNVSRKLGRFRNGRTGFQPFRTPADAESLAGYWFSDVDSLS
jgi:hypothetical protein